MEPDDRRSTKMYTVLKGMTAVVTWMFLFPVGGFDRRTQDQLVRAIVILGVVKLVFLWRYTNSIGTQEEKAGFTLVWWAKDLFEFLFLVVARTLMSTVTITFYSFDMINASLALIASMSGIFLNSTIASN